MSKNVIHNFNLSIQNSTDVKSSEDLTNVMIKELAKVSKEMNQQKDIVQIWQEQQNGIMPKKSHSLTEGGTTDAKAETKTAISAGNTPSSSGEIGPNVLTGLKTSTSGALIGGGVPDINGKATMSSATSANITSPVFGVENNTLNFSTGLTTQTYATVTSQESLKVPQNLQTNSGEPTVEVIKAEIKKKLEAAIAAKDTIAIGYWTNLAKAFDEGTTAKDFDGKPDHILFTQMYVILNQSNAVATETQNFNWDIIREKMIASIDTNILNGTISPGSKERWKAIKKQLGDDKTNIANLFEQYDELFLLLKEVEGLDVLPNNITITAKTKIYPNLSADKLYAAIGKEHVYIFLKEVNDLDVRGSVVNKGAVKIKNTNANSFIVGESLEFFLDETFIKQNLYEKENINWMVYKGKEKQGTIFKDKGTSFIYNFDTAGTYKVEAYGNSFGANSKSAKESAFIELKIVAQEIIITAPGNLTNGITRVCTKEQLFNVSLKNPKVKTLNPLKLYYQVEITTANKVTKIAEEQELDPKGIIKLAMPELGEYKIKVTGKDQYALTQEAKISVIQNEVVSIGPIKEDSGKSIFILGNPGRTLTLEAKTFKINPPTDKEKESVKWIIYDSNNKPYLPPGDLLLTKNKDPEKTYLIEWSSYVMSIPQKEGNYTIEAYSEVKKGSKAGCIFKIEVQRPQVTEAYWAWSGGSKKESSGFSGESNWIKANIPYYNNQTARIYFYLDGVKTNSFCDVKTNKKGEIFQKIIFDSAFKKRIGFPKTKNAKIGFTIEGIQNGKPYQFKTPAYKDSDTVMSVTADPKILDAYFMFEGNRVTQQDEIPFSNKATTITIVAKTQNMIGKEIVLIAHKQGEKPSFRHESKVNSEGVATISFILKNLNEELKKGTKIKYYVGVEGYSTKHLTNKALTMVMDSGKTTENTGGTNFELTWGARVNKEFRDKVIEICSDLWPQNTLEMANGLMAVMYRETNKTFAANQMAGYKSLIPRNQMTKESFENINKKTGKMSSRAVGLIQFTQAALVSMKEFENGKGFDKLHELKLEYAKMTEVKQLEKVRKYFKSVVRLPKVPEDIYVAVFSPGFVGSENTDTLYKKGTDSYAANPGLDKNNDGIQKRELLVKYRESLKEGNEKVNIASVTIASTTIPSVNVKKKEEIIANSELEKVKLHFEGKTAVENSLSAKTKNILKEVGIKSKNYNIHITSTARGTYDQARIMYQNCAKPGGIERQKGIYAIPGQKVVDVYAKRVKSGDSKEAIITAMENKIKDLGPSTVSKHIADFKVMNTLDIDYGKLSNKNDFLDEINKRKELDKVLIENNCYHIQIKQ